MRSPSITDNDFVRGLAIAIGLVVLYALAVQAGNLAGHGLTEWNVR